MIKAILFDLDGVLIDADKWHFNTLNVALQHADIDPISWQEHLTIYKGIPTREKLRVLTERKGLPRELWEKIHTCKQEMMIEVIHKFCVPDPEKVEMMRLLKRRHKILVCSNAVRASVELMLSKSGLLPYVDGCLSNEDVSRPKPAPDIYERAFEQLGVEPDECVVVEDSDVGKKAAGEAGAVLCSVNAPAEVNYYRVLQTIHDAQRVNLVVPAAGQGKRFSEVGYQHPKPLIDVRGRPMIQWVLENFGALGRPIVILQRKHAQQYCAEHLLRHLNPAAAVVTLDGLTDGAACTVLSARELINHGNELVIANSDQVVDADLSEFVNRMRDIRADGGILTFRDSHPKWSYARVDATGRVLEVAEKVPISEHATVGIYYYRRGRDFVRFAEEMIRKNIRVNGEFYVCPVFNEFVAAGKRVFIHEIGRGQMHGLGTPEDLEKFLARLPRLAETEARLAA